jgi:signal transduction histidine kinase
LSEECDLNLNEAALFAIVGLLLAAHIALLLQLRRTRQTKTALGPQRDPRARSDGLGVEEILERMTEGVLVLNADLAPTLVNRAARSLLGLGHNGAPVVGASEEVLAVARAAMAEHREIESQVNIWFPKRGNLRVRATPLSEHDGAVIVIQDITEELRTQRIRREFVAHASHELKSPVASLQTLAEALRQAVSDDPAAAERFSGRLVLEAERLGRLIADLLDLSRLEDPDKVVVELVDLSVVAQRETRAISDEAESKGVGVSAHIAPAVGVEGDAQQLSLMLRNLLDNAIRYTPAGGHVALDVRREDRSAVIRVIDTGIGIPREAQSRVFERFYRVDRARSRDKGGTGLGLAIVKHAVELHGGTIELDSELEQGSTFTVKLPVGETARVENIAG